MGFGLCRLDTSAGDTLRKFPLAKKIEKKTTKTTRRKPATKTEGVAEDTSAPGQIAGVEPAAVDKPKVSGGRGRGVRGAGASESAAQTSAARSPAEVKKDQDAVVIRFAPIRPPGYKPEPTPSPKAVAPAPLTVPQPPPVAPPRIEPRVEVPPPADRIPDRPERGNFAPPRPEPGPREGGDRGRHDQPPGRRDDGRRGGGQRDNRDQGNRRGDQGPRRDDQGPRRDNQGPRRDERGPQDQRGRGQPRPNEFRDTGPQRPVVDRPPLDRSPLDRPPVDRPPVDRPGQERQGPERFGPEQGPEGDRPRGRRRRRGRRGRGGNRDGGPREFDDPRREPLPRGEPQRGELAFGPDTYEKPVDEGLPVEAENGDWSDAAAAATAADLEHGAIVDFDALEERVAADEGDVEVIEPTPVVEDEDGDEAEVDEDAGVEREPGAPVAPERGRGPRDRDRRPRGRGRRFFRRDDDEAAPRDDMETGEGATEPIEIGGEEDQAEAAAAPKVPARKDMIINVTLRDECRIAIMENGRLEEMYLERASAESHVGNIYKGIVTNVEPSIQAAFIDFGLGKNGFLHISDLNPSYFPDGENITESVGRKISRRHRPPIQKCLRRGMEMLVQITKEGIGTKGPTLTTYMSIPGRFLVMMPGMRKLGVSRKIEDEDTRRNVREVLDGLELPDDVGFIARTAAKDRSKRELQSDLNYLLRLWRAVQVRIRNDRAPTEVYRDNDLVIRTIRDVYGDDIQRIIVDDAEMAGRGREFLSIFDPRAGDVVQIYDRPEPIFHHYGIEQELERLHSRHVQLKSGGYLVIDQAEALVAIDVNSGKFRTEDDAETTAYKMNMEAADEISRQLRLRDLGGVIVCDFIDMRAERHRRDVEKRLIINLKKHKERAKILRMSAFGIIEMTRQRQRASLTRSVYQDCHHCRGTGLVKTIESVSLDLMRQLQFAMTRENIKAVELTVSSDVAFVLQNRKRLVLNELETKFRKNIAIKGDANFSIDQVQMTCTDIRGRLIPMA